jgi:curli biogenesis system outer membrane secretion channel CsgG
MTPANFFQETRKFYVFNRKDLPKLRREQLFIQLLEALHPSEAKIIVAMKDQNLNSLYNNITHQVLAQYGLIPEQKETPDGDQASKKS